MATDPNILDLGFNLPELTISSVILDGLELVRTDTSIVPMVFNQLTRDYNSQKYGAGELTKIQNVVNSKTVAVVYSYFDIDAKSPCFSIMVSDDVEDKNRAHLDDEYVNEIDPITDSQQLTDLILLTFVPLGYNATTGMISVPDSADLSEVYYGMNFIDNAGTTFEVQRGVNNLPGQKCIFIGPGLSPNITSTCTIQSSLTSTVTDVKGVTADVRIVIGVHTKDVLLTKYLYVLLKYFILSRKWDLNQRGFYIATWSGSDFSRTEELKGNHIYTRFLTVSGKVDDTWRGQVIPQIDNIVIEPNPETGTEES